jgi:hypothetical protein
VEQRQAAQAAGEDARPFLVEEYAAERRLGAMLEEDVLLLFGEVGDPSSAEAKALPIVDDRRTSSAGLTLGMRLDPVDLDAATRLGSLVPADVGSEAESLGVSVTDAGGFLVHAKPSGWDAIFGFYTPSLRTPELIPGQVRLLRSLLIGREQLVDRVILASDTDGTYIPKPTPTPVESARP